MQDWKNKLRVIHDKIKENPYWINFDDRLLLDLVHDFRELSDNYWNLEKSVYGKDPYYEVLRVCCHDFNAMLSNIQYWQQDEIWEKEKWKVVLVLQTYLSNIHRMIDEINPCDTVVTGYTVSMKCKNFKAYLLGLKTFVAEWIEDEKSDKSRYYALNLIEPKSLNGLKKILEEDAKDKRHPNTQAWAIECLKNIEDGKTIIGKTWKIKETK